MKTNFSVNMNGDKLDVRYIPNPIQRTQKQENQDTKQEKLKQGLEQNLKQQVTKSNDNDYNAKDFRKEAIIKNSKNIK